MIFGVGKVDSPLLNNVQYGKWGIAIAILLALTGWEDLVLQVGAGVSRWANPPPDVKKNFWLRNYHKTCLGIGLNLWVNDWNSESESN